MKLGKYLIVSLVDFRRHYDFKLFYQSRDEFVRDMHPDKIFYWDDKLIEAYQQICRWIQSKENPTMRQIPDYAVRALQTYVGKADVTAPTENVDIDLSQKVIHLPADYELNLPAFNFDHKPATIKINLHKIVADKKSVDASSVRIGDEIVELAPGAVVYATECNGQFIQFLTNRLSNDKISAELINKDDSFGSILVIEDLKTGQKTTTNNIVAFAIMKDTAITIDSEAICDFGEISFLMDVDAISETNWSIEPVNIITNVPAYTQDSVIGILYSNGTLKTTSLGIPFEKIENVVYVRVKEKHIVTK